MVAFLDRYYGFILALALPAPLWLGALWRPQTVGLSALHDGLVWTAMLLCGWLVVRKIPRYQIRGVWRRPTREESNRYLRLLLAVLIIDFGSKALFFRWDRPQQVEIFKNFGLHSVFHATEFENFHVYLLLYFGYLFVLAPWYFRFANPAHDRVWTFSCASAMGGALALVGERLFFGGVHNSFYFAGSLMWICPPCASPRFISYAWTPADFFVHAAFLPFIILIASYFNPRNRFHPAAETSLSTG
jgi:lipoprotein signal peptidase